MLLRAATYPVMPWKNGGGTTREVAVFPHGASMEDFDWRISMATVAQDGAFSCLPDIERTLFLLEGAGMVLKFDEHSPVELRPVDVIEHFAADTKVFARLLDGPITDLNIMTRRSRMTHQAVKHRIVGNSHITHRRGSTLALVFLDDGLQLVQNNTTVALQALDCFLLEADSAGVTLQSNGLMIQIEFELK